MSGNHLKSLLVREDEAEFRMFNADMIEDNTEDKDEIKWGLPEGPPPKLDLPFSNKRKKETGEWIYDNRETICITVIAYLIVAIFVMLGKIIITPKEPEAAVIVEVYDPEELQKLEEELQRAQELNKMLNAVPDYGSVQNAVSNENASREARQDGVSEETRRIMESSDRVMRDMDRNGDEYNQKIAEIGRERTSDDSGQERRDTKMDANVTVSFSLANPVRNSVKLDIPAYKCRGGGRVVVNVVVSRNGDVVAASVDRTRSVQDDCMTETALDAAKRSRFNVNPSAPVKHAGFIVYTFVPQ